MDEENKINFKTNQPGKLFFFAWCIFCIVLAGNDFI